MWWDIIKNQIASTKGKTFQLDFNQPMIEEEEEDCKKRFQAVQTKLRMLTIAELREEEESSGSYDNHYHYDEKREFGAFRPELEIFLLFEKNIPDEIYCKAIEQYENTPIGESKLEDYGEYRVLTENREVGKSRGSEERDNFDNNVYDISIYLIEKPSEGPLASIYVRHRIFYDGRYGDGGKTNPELDDKIERIIKGALVF
tara:strand:+ start:5041 stop:5643 length:603 start_codon:yes stop_codon:yes gene_type:complete